MSDELIKKESTELSNKDISEIVSNDEVKEMLMNIVRECDEQRNEAVDMYFIYKDLINNSGDMESSSVIKEQVASLLAVGNEAIAMKIRVFDTLVRAKTKKDGIIQEKELDQASLFVSNRREFLQAIEESKIDKTIEEEKIIENINKDIDEDFSIEIGSGEFE